MFRWGRSLIYCRILSLSLIILTSIRLLRLFYRSWAWWCGCGRRGSHRWCSAIISSLSLILSRLRISLVVLRIRRRDWWYWSYWARTIICLLSLGLVGLRRSRYWWVRLICLLSIILSNFGRSPVFLRRGSCWFRSWRRHWGRCWRGRWSFKVEILRINFLSVIS